MAQQGLASSVPFANFISSTNDGWIMNLVLGMMYVVFPVFWIGMLSWIGVNLGTAISTGLEKGGSLPQKAGAEAGRDAQKIATDKAGGALKGGLKLK
ncbi:hypothetical protein BJF97_02300 [Klebsiella sp. LTGPAF-6F]|nr:hypothetical protein BJF97_02300 [Klebsiella sp. LTGPAF-6F]